MKKLILKCDLSPGDIVMLTAAVRDLHLCYPKQFATDVRTLCPDLWENNPHLTPLKESEPGVEVIECEYPLINECDVKPYHCLHGFTEFLSDRLGLRIRPSQFRGDLHLSAQEKSWASQVHEYTEEATPFWLLAAGGKYDVTVKWWSPDRYQKVIDHFRGKILFVQVGQSGHHHPKLNGVVDLRGMTSLRELIRLVYHSQGVLCPITAVMHLAAAVERPSGHAGPRPCVVLAGGREPAHWEQYPGHQFLHTLGVLKCCATSGCWRDRVTPLGDGDPRDGVDHLCLDVVKTLPRCMDMISVDEVVHRVEMYFAGGTATYLKGREWRAAKHGIHRTRQNRFEQMGLRLSNARLEFERFARQLPEYPGHCKGRGIVVCGGGVRYFTNAWVTLNRLRDLGCKLPIQLWHLGPRELDATMAGLLRKLDVQPVDAQAVRDQFPVRRLGGWEMKSYAVLRSPFEEVLSIDADNVPVADPTPLFDAPQFREVGAVFWPDFGRLEATQKVWDLLGLERPTHPEFESGQMLLNKRVCWRALVLAAWFNEHSDFFFQVLHGDKETFHLAFRKLGQPFVLMKTPLHPLPGTTMCQHDFEGRRLFQHRNSDKWNLFANNPRVEDFWHEDECRRHLKELQRVWPGWMEHDQRMRYKLEIRLARRYHREPRIMAGIISCLERDAIRQQTLASLARTDWPQTAIWVQLDDATGGDREARQTRNALRLLQRFLSERGDYLLFLEDDLEFNTHLRHNLMHWAFVRSRSVTLASLYNPGVPEMACALRYHAYLAGPEFVHGSQALLLSRDTVEHLVLHWDEVPGMQDVKMSRLAGQLKRPIAYHSPSLVQHVGKASTWGGSFHEAKDFDPTWKTPDP